MTYCFFVSFRSLYPLFSLQSWVTRRLVIATPPVHAGGDMNLACPLLCESQTFLLSLIVASPPELLYAEGDMNMTYRIFASPVFPLL